MREEPSILHVDLDAFFASVEQRDKPSLRGKPVVVGGIGLRGVVSTASYEARAFGARSAMSTAEARAICPSGTAFLWPRFEAYRKSSLVVMALLRELSPLVEQVSIDEAYVDLRGADLDDLSSGTVSDRLEQLDQDIRAATGGLTASAGAASSKMLAKIGSDLHKPNGITVVEAGDEQALLAPMSVRAISGVGPATGARLRTFGVETVADLRRMSRPDLVSIFGERHGASLYDLARARDDRELELSREAKSISNEETFERDVHESAVLHREIGRIAESVAARAEKAGVFGRTVHLKVRLPDFSSVTRSSTTATPVRDPDAIARTARRLLDTLDIPQGVRLVGVGLSGFVTHAQSGLFDLDLPGSDDDDRVERPEAYGTPVSPPSRTTETVQGRGAPDVSQDGRAPAGASATVVGTMLAGSELSTRFSPSREHRWRTGMDVEHPVHGAGWVWGSGRGRVTVRFEGPDTPPGPVHTFSADDEELRAAEAPSWSVLSSS